MTTRFQVGAATDVGQLRTKNEDSKFVGDGVSVFAVADGMGGHQGGAVASAIAVETLEATLLESTTVSAVVEAVKEANRRIFSRSADTPELHGMGTTLVAIALVNPDGDDEELAWVNVGDSRAYMLRDGTLEQLSRDHSLVEDLLRGGQLSAEEAEVHPQRNILTRALGIDQEVEVDSGAVIPLQGDRFLLCSDGLFNEVDRPTITSTLGSIEDPDAAAEALVRLANEGGGRDNITCVVADVIDDGGRAAGGAPLAGAPQKGATDGDATVVADAPSEPDPGVALPVTSELPAVDLEAGPAEVDVAPVDTTPPTGLPATPVSTDVAPAAVEGTEAVEERSDGGLGRPGSGEPPQHATDEELPFGRGTTDVYDDMQKVRGRHWAFTGLAVVVVLAAVAGGAYLGLSWYANRTYFVGPSGTEVAIYQGKPGGFLVFDPAVEERSDRELGDFSASERDDIRAEPEFESLADAQSYMNNLETRADQREDDTASTTTTTEGRPTTTEGRPSATDGGGDGGGVNNVPTTEGRPTTTEGQ